MSGKKQTIFEFGMRSGIQLAQSGGINEPLLNNKIEALSGISMSPGLLGHEEVIDNTFYYGIDPIHPMVIDNLATTIVDDLLPQVGIDVNYYFYGFIEYAWSLTPLSALNIYNVESISGKFHFNISAGSIYGRELVPQDSDIFDYFSFDGSLYSPQGAQKGFRFEITNGSNSKYTLGCIRTLSLRLMDATLPVENPI